MIMIIGHGQAYCAGHSDKKTCDMRSFEKDTSGSPMLMKVEEKQSLLNDGGLVGHIDTVQEFTDILVPYPADTLDRRSCKKREKHETSTLRDMVVDLPDCETFCTSLPSRMSSSFCVEDSETVTPSNIATCRTI